MNITLCVRTRCSSIILVFVSRTARSTVWVSGFAIVWRLYRIEPTRAVVLSNVIDVFDRLTEVLSTRRGTEDRCQSSQQKHLRGRRSLESTPEHDLETTPLDLDIAIAQQGTSKISAENQEWLLCDAVIPFSSRSSIYPRTLVPVRTFMSYRLMKISRLHWVLLPALFFAIVGYANRYRLV